MIKRFLYPLFPNPYPLFFVALLVLGIVFLSSSITIAADSSAGVLTKADLTLDDIIANIQANQSQIKDMSADTVTTITSTMKNAKTMTQRGKILMKYPGKSRVEMFEPTHQITINNGEKIILINKDTGQRYEQDVTKTQGMGQDNQNQMNFDKAKEFFGFSAKRNDGNFLITGIPKSDNKFLGKMEFYVDAERWVPVRIAMYSPSVASAKEGKLMSQSEIEYQRFSISYSEAPSIARSEGVWVMTKTTSNVSMPMGSMKMEMEYENIKVNQGISDREFEG